MLDPPHPLLLRAGKGAGLVTEKLALDDLFGQRAAVQRHEIALRTTAPTMQQARNNLLAATGFAGDKHIDIGIGDLAQHMAQALHHRGLPNQRQARVGLLRASRRLRFSITSARFSAARRTH